MRCPGSLLAALLMDAGKAAAGGRSEGLLLGCGKRRREEVRGDDVHEAGERVVLEAGMYVRGWVYACLPTYVACGIHCVYIYLTLYVAWGWRHRAGSEG